MKLENVKVGMRVFVKDHPASKAAVWFRGQFATVLDNDRTSGGTFQTDYQIQVQLPSGSTDIMDACDVRKLRGGEV